MSARRVEILTYGPGRMDMDNVNSFCLGFLLIIIINMRYYFLFFLGAARRAELARARYACTVFT